MRKRAVRDPDAAVESPQPQLQQQHEHDPDTSSLLQLNFDELLSWPAAKPIAVGQLLRRLQSLATELNTLEQDLIDRSSLSIPAQALASQNLLTHKDKGVRAWTARCLVDVLRLCAPEAPYTTSQTKEIFTLFITSIIPAIQDPLNPYNAQHLYVLDSLAQVKSVILLVDVPSSQALILRLFTTCFDILSSSADDLSKVVEYNITALLECIVDECHTLPAEVIDIILAQLLRVDNNFLSHSQEKKTGQPILQITNIPSSYTVAKNICNSCQDRMKRYISQYFSSVIIDATSINSTSATKPKPKRRARAGSLDSNSDEELQSGISPEDLKELQKAHRLLRELWRACPDVLQNVIPQIEAEMSAENVDLRLLATEAVGDIAAGLGASSPPLLATLNATCYPSMRLRLNDQETRAAHAPTARLANHVFPQLHASAYRSFLGRRLDKSPLIRATWTLSIGRILVASPNGPGLDSASQLELTSNLASMLIDSDEKVRTAAIQAVSLFSLEDVVYKLGSLGGVSDAGTLLSNLADRVKDRKQAVRAEAISLLGKLWGAAVGEIAAGNSQVKTLLGSVPSRIFDARYVNDMDINLLIDQVLLDSLIPLGFPSTKKTKPANGESHSNGGDDADESEANRARTQRILLVLNDLDQRAQSVFLALIARSSIQGNYVVAFLKRCEDYNGGVIEHDEADVKKHLRKIIEYLSATFPDKSRVSEDLQRFAKLHDRRSYQLIRFCVSSDSDYRKVYKSMKELRRRLQTFPSGTPSMALTIETLVSRVANLFFNKSHLQAILDYSKTDEDSLGSAAHLLLKEISSKSPGVYKSLAEDLCRSVEVQAPAAGKPNEPGTLVALKACATFASTSPKDIPRDRKFIQSMIAFAIHGSPPACAKHAVSIIMSGPEKKQMYARDLLHQCTEGFKYGSVDFLTKLACMSQLMLFASMELEEEDCDPVVDIAIKQILIKTRTEKKENDTSWMDELDQECEAKIWALKILANRVRSFENSESLSRIAQPVYQLLNTLIAAKGELSKDCLTPESHKARLRLHAGLLYLKFCNRKNLELFLTPSSFNRISLLAQDELPQVRKAFVNKIKKYLGQDRLPSRFYTIMFLLAFEPDRRLREDATTWIRARTATLSKQKRNVMETVFARFLSLLAHHPDFSDSADDLEPFVRYVAYYLKSVATQENVSYIYQVAQRVKAVQDGIDEGFNNSLYCLSDLAQAVIKLFEEIYHWSIQTLPDIVKLPSGIFAKLPDHDVAQEVSSRQYLPEELLDRLGGLVRDSLKSNKRKSDSEPSQPSKKRSTTSSNHTQAQALRSRKPNKFDSNRKRQISTPEAPMSERRRSGRGAGRKSYAESIESEGVDDDGIGLGRVAGKENTSLGSDKHFNDSE